MEVNEALDVEDLKVEHLEREVLELKVLEVLGQSQKYVSINILALQQLPSSFTAKNLNMKKLEFSSR